MELIVWRILAFLRHKFPTQFPKFESFVRKLLLRAEIGLVWPMRNLNRKRDFELHYPSWDYLRISNLELVAHEINKNKVAGNVAELGVFQGDFALKINEAFPNRKLYLFDTFTGFDERDVIVETEKKINTPNKTYPSAVVEKVLARMPHPKKIVIRQGFFPDTAAGLEDERFAFVSLDPDLYQPTLEGLKFFYPRLNSGGYIFVHDFHSRNFPGCGDAVREFIKATGAKYIPITDQGGSVIICAA
jgi:O-methyltransferase